MDFLSRRARELTPYVPGEQPARPMIKLNTNENPYPPAPGVAQAIAAVDPSDLRRYPKPECEPLRDLVAAQEGLPGREYVYFGNGSDEMLAYVFGAFFDPEKPVRFADVSYSFYPVYCDLWQLPYEAIPLREDWRWAIEDYAGEGGGIVLPNPNAPTALALSLDELRSLLDQHPNEVIVLDEAYVMFGTESAVRLIPEYPNLLVVRTLSKSHALAGQRVGYCMGQPHLIEGVIRVKNSFNSYTLDTVAQAAAYAALSDTAYTRARCDQVMATRSRTMDALSVMGFEMTDAKANFIFATHPKVAARTLFEALREHGILVRYFSSPARVSNHLRITIGTDAEMDAFLTAVRQILQAHHAL